MEGFIFSGQKVRSNYLEKDNRSTKVSIAYIFNFVKGMMILERRKKFSTDLCFHFIPKASKESFSKFMLYMIKAI